MDARTNLHAIAAMGEELSTFLEITFPSYAAVGGLCNYYLQRLVTPGLPA